MDTEKQDLLNEFLDLRRDDPDFAEQYDEEDYSVWIRDNDLKKDEIIEPWDINQEDNKPAWK